MLNLQRDGFSAALVRMALHAPWGTRQGVYKYELLDRNNRVKREITNMLADGNSVSFNALDDIKRKAKFNIADDNTIDFMSDRIKPYERLWVPPGRILRSYLYLSPWQVTESDLQMAPADGGWVDFPLGVFLLSSPELTEDDGGALVRQVEAYDQTKLLLDDKVDGKYLIQKNVKFTDAIKNALLVADIAQTNVAPSDKVMPFDREWDAGTSRLEIINDLLEAMNYYPLWFDEEGIAIASPYVPPEQAGSEYTYADDDKSVIARPVRKKMDAFDVPNKWVFYTSDSGSAPLRSIYVNDSPNSAVSTVSRGRTIVDYRRVDAADQSALDGLVKRAANDANSIFEEVTWKSWPMPMHGHRDSYTFTYSGMGISAKFMEVSWDMELHASGVMNHQCRRAVTF